MSRSKEHRFQVAGKERENGWQNCGSACSWGGGGRICRKKERKKETLNLKLNTKPLKFKWGLAKGGEGAGWSTHQGMGTST
jgi:hypothetical protein